MYSNGTAPKTFTGTSSAAEIMPHSEEAETAVLGSILIDPDAFYEVDLVVNPEDFYSKQRGQVYQAMRDLYAGQTAVDVLTVTELLERRDIARIGKDDTAAYIIGLVSAVPTAINVSNYARIVAADAMRRRLIHAGEKIRKDALNHGENINKLVEGAEKDLFTVTQKSATKNVTPIKQGMSRLIDVTMERVQAGGETNGIMTGWLDFDRLVRGLKKQRLYILAARPGMGKSIAESNIAINAASNGYRVGRFNLEMGIESLLQRAVAAKSKIPFSKIEDGKLTPAELATFNRAAGKLSELPMWIDDSADLSLSQLRAKARRLYAEHGLDLITVDYLTLMRVESSYGNRTQDVGQISRGLSRLAKDLDVPILALAQLSRQCEQRSDKRPVLSDLRDSGEIEQDASCVVFMYRDEYYNPDTTERPNIVELNVAKNRHGKTGSADLYFHGDTMRLVNLKVQSMQL